MCGDRQDKKRLVHLTLVNFCIIFARYILPVCTKIWQNPVMEILTLRGLEAIYRLMIFKESLLICISTKYLITHLKM